MKRFLMLLSVLIFSTAFFISCGEDDNIVTPPAYGTLSVFSVPDGATIFIDGEDSGFLTDYTFTEMDPGTHDVLFSKEGFVDTTVTVTVNENETSTVIVELTAELTILNYGPIRIYETAGTTEGQPSGIDLSSGNAFGISGDDKDSVDIYFSTELGYLVSSAEAHPNMTRSTFFYEGNSLNLDDGEDSPTVNSPNNWETNMSEAAENYYFLYDQDGKYSKFKIVGSGGGNGPGDPRWLEVEWLYNNNIGDKRF